VDSTPGPQLSEDQKNEALQILTDTPGVAHTIAAAGHSIEGVGVWAAQDGSIRGAFIFIRLTTPQTIEGDWPVINHHSSVETSEHKIVCYLSDVDVYVDLGERKVVSIEPILINYPTVKPCTGTASPTGGP
jgi:hypothetical protein